MSLIAKLFFMLASFLKLFSFTGSDASSITTQVKNNMIQDTVKKPSVNIEEALVDTMTILVINETAASVGDISRVIGAGYGELFTYINQTGLQPGKIMAFYSTYEPPFIMKIAVEVNKIPAKLTGRIKLDKIYGGNAVIARYKGPYDKIGIAYTEIFSWIKEHQKEARGLPFEVYLDDPATVKDPFDLRTDVYQLLK